MTITDELIAHVAGEPHERQQRFARSRDIYEGTMDAPLVNPDDGTDNTLDGVILGAAKNIVDTGVDFLFGEGVTFDVSEAYGEGAQKRLSKLWRDNRMDTCLLELGLHGGQTGEFVFKFEPDTRDQSGGAHRWIVADPAYLDVVWDPHDTSVVLLYRFEYPTVDRDENGKLIPFVWRQDIEAIRTDPDEHGRREITSWTITNSRAKIPSQYGGIQRWLGFGATRQITKWQQISQHPWPYAWAPVFAGQNQISPNSWWGYSDVEALIVRLINSTNRSVSNIAKTIRHFAHPQTIVIGATLPDDTAIGEPIELEGPRTDVDVFNLEMRSDLAGSLEFMRELRAEVYDAGNVPDIARGKLDGVGQLSGVAMRLQFGPLLGITGRKRKTYGDEIAAALRCALEYMGFKPQGDADAEVMLIWGDPLPKNEKEDAEVGEIDQRLGASKRTILARRGFDPDQEAENRLEEGSMEPELRGMAEVLEAPQEQPETPEPASKPAADDDGER